MRWNWMRSAHGTDALAGSRRCLILYSCRCRPPPPAPCAASPPSASRLGGDLLCQSGKGKGKGKGKA
ncbi:hypothetical protein RHMOL_Rhmol06G0168800 [Rhododendron molle]|uniref:Uncharacterized protein n=1 Tax=Rhododendron molle TaxID=49168 RepID=A0ACC0NF26_RHOML|nr:hypothetical protein RHMOL_Rhmol06G0168800 [Rhododendron molle]